MSINVGTAGRMRSNVVWEPTTAMLLRTHVTHVTRHVFLFSSTCHYNTTTATLHYLLHIPGVRGCYCWSGMCHSLVSCNSYLLWGDGCLLNTCQSPLGGVSSMYGCVVAIQWVPLPPIQSLSLRKLPLCNSWVVEFIHCRYNNHVTPLLQCIRLS